MIQAQVISVNVGVSRPSSWSELGVSAFVKTPVAGPVVAAELGLAGDEQADTDAHGGAEQAIYVYAREDLDWWVEQLGRELVHGAFGENLTTAGLEVTGALIGEVWQLGPVLAQVTSPRIPCVTFKGYLGEDHWVKRFAAARRPGAYLRVLTGGPIAAGDPVTVLSRPDEQVTIAEAMGAYYGDVDAMRRLIRVEGHSSRWDAVAAAVLGRTSSRT